MRRFLSNLANLLNATNTARAARRGARRVPLRVEALEERQLLTLPPAAILTPIAAEYAATAGEMDAYGNNVQQLLGAATSGPISVPGKVAASMETFEHGTIYYSDSTGAAVVYGDVAVKYRSLGGPAAFGLPTSDEAPVPGVAGVRVTNFDGGRAILWSQATGSHALLAGIGAEYTATANEKDAYGKVVQAVLGAPTSDETDAPGVAGARMNTFVGGTIYWSPDTKIGAHVVYGGIAAKYASLGASGTTTIKFVSSGGYVSGSSSVPITVIQPGFGLPVSDEAGVPGVPGLRVTNFEGDRSIYWSPWGTGAHAVTGTIGVEYQATAGETDASGKAVQAVLGAPTSDETGVPGVAGASMITFQGGTIYASGVGTHAVYGAIAAKYASVKGPAGSLGLPNGDEHAVTGGREQSFQYGRILLTPQGAQVIDRVSSMTFTWSYVGFSDGTPVGGGPFQLTVWENGSYQITGHLHSSGFFGENDKLRIDLLGRYGAIWSKTHEGHMAGSLQYGSRDDPWNESSVSANLARHWGDLEGGQILLSAAAGRSAPDWSSLTRKTDQWIIDNGYGGITYSKVGLMAGTDKIDSPSAYDNLGALIDTLGHHPITSDYARWDLIPPPGTEDTPDAPPCEVEIYGESCESFTVTPLAVNGDAVTLDASALGVPSLSLDGVAYDATAPFSAQLLPGAHSLSTNTKDGISFTVNPDGTLAYDPSLEGALTGAGTTALAVHGFAVTLDPTALGVAGLALDNMPLDGTAPSSANLLPGQHTLTTNGTDVTSFIVNPDGTVAYDPALEGALTGNGTTALAVIGRAVALDASALGAASVSVDGAAHAATAPFSVNLLPGQHSLSTDGTDVTWFTVNADGTISYDPLLQGALTGSGTTSLAVSGRAVTLDATALGVPSVSVDGVAYAATAPFSVNLLPGQHSLNDGTNVISLSVNPDGTVTYDPALQGTITGSGTTSLLLQLP
jgi:hypothetical protein